MNKLDDLLDKDVEDSPYLQKASLATAKSESFKSRRYRLPKEKYDTIGYGHYIEDKDQYYSLAKDLGIKNPESLTREEALNLFQHDFKNRRNEIAGIYNTTSPALLDIMTNKKFQYSPKGFEKRFGKHLRENNLEGLVDALYKEAAEKKAQGFGGFVPRNNEVISQLREYGKEIQRKIASKDESRYDLRNIDGVIGPKTLAALTQYQKDNGLTPNGMLGPDTLALLMR